MSDREILVTSHALEKFKTRTRRWDEDDDILREEIACLVRMSSVVAKRPGNAWEIKAKGHSFVVVFEKGTIVVITFLGDRIYRRWAKRIQSRERYGRRATCWANLISSLA